jgi:hypothetical protein
LQEYNFYRFWTYISKLWGNENFGRSLVRGACAEPTTMSWSNVPKNVGRKKNKKFVMEKKGHPHRGGQWPLVPVAWTSQLLVAASLPTSSPKVGQGQASCPPTVARSLFVHIDCGIAEFFYFFFLTMKEMGLAFWEARSIALPLFESCPCSWKNKVFLFFQKLEYATTFISTILGFCLMQSQFTKIPQELLGNGKFCTLLHCKVHLSMLHSSPTSKIWYTTTWHDVHWDDGEL